MKRYYIEGESIFFTKIKAVVHISFAKRYRGLSYTKARKKLKALHSRASQTEMLHYLKHEGYLKIK